MIKAVGLLSGGLDSTLAAKLLIDQGIAVHAINFYSPFCTCTAKNKRCAAVVTTVKQLGDIPLKRVALGDEYLEVVRNPKHGHGRGMNPCIDCRIIKLQKSAEYMREIGACFLFTGEVLGQRPMSQHRKALRIIDVESGLQGLILRPLCAAHMEPTVPEQKGWVDRSKLMDISGRSRKRQISLAAERGINDYPCPAGGCLLTDKNFADRMRDYFSHMDKPSLKDIPLLKVGRHRRLENGDKVIIARDEEECRLLRTLAKEDDHLLEPEFSGPVVILQGNDLETAIACLCQHTTKAFPEGTAISHYYKGKTEKLAANRQSRMPDKPAV
jgi:tRNA-uridine 2-sulfurtransferase